MQTIDRNELKRMMDGNKDFVLIETLKPEAFNTEHLPGAINIPAGADDFEAQAREAVPDKDRTIVVYCANTDCPASPNAAKKLEGLGYSDVRDYEAGKEDWKDAGLELVA